jgi:ribosomal protein L37AE/L43A
MRKSVDLTELGKRKVLSCPSCGRQMSEVEFKPNTSVWFCGLCVVYHEATPDGCVLGSFRRVGNQIVFLPEGKNGV